ncbi:MAG: TetR/AcrR family transcriptional regulator [Dechloromonas sp.]|nr:TetR/AcrR family transcriptional regulator [Dechloromonas sp.]
MGRQMSDEINEPGRRERKLQQQRDHLADTAWELFETEGYDSVTMERIAAVADVAKGTLYKHFPVKEALLRHCFHRELREGEAEGRRVLLQLAPGRPRLEKFLQVSAAWSEPRRRYLLPYLMFRLGEPGRRDGRGERSGMEQIFTWLLADGQAAGCFRTDVAAPALAVYLEFLYVGAMLRWLTGAAASLTAEMDTMLDVFLGGVEVRP